MDTDHIIRTIMAKPWSNTYGLLTTANLWIGVAVGLALLYASIKMRRYRDEG